MSKFDLTDKVALITGGGSGIGQAIAKTFAAQWAYVCILDFSLSGAEATVADISEAGGTAKAYRCDVSDGESVQSIVQAIHREKASIDILVNNAGIAHVGNIEGTTPEDLDRLYNVNIKGVYHCIKACIPFFKAQQKGVILNLASIASSVAVADRFAYSMTKGAVLTMTYSIAKDYINDGIRCNCISPGRVHTPFVDGFIKKNYPENQAEMFEKLAKTQPIGRMGQPQEMADLVLFLCSDEAGFITGTDYPIDGGFIKLNG